MPLATVTVREVKNKSSGIDLNVPTYKETPGLLGSSVEYQVVVVSSLPFFKSPKHRESDVVQFVISKKFSDFEELHNKLNEKFSGTAFPPLPRKVLRVNDVVARERRNELDHYLKMIANVPKIVSSSTVLEFLGVNPIKAGKYRPRGSAGDERKVDEDHRQDQQTSEDRTDEQSPSSDLNLFDDDVTEEDNTDELFAVKGDNQTSDLFSTDTSSTKRSEAVLFEDQDYGGGITEEDEEKLFLPDSIITTKVVVQSSGSDVTPDLFEIDDNLDDLMNISVKTSKDKEYSTNVSTNEDNSSIRSPANEETASKDIPANEETASTNHPTNDNIPSSHPSNQNEASKPPKPQLAQKPKPAPRSKLIKVTETPFEQKPKPAVRQKPPVAKKPELQEGVKGTDSVDSLQTEDILKYIQINTESKESDLDLFS